MKQTEKNNEVKLINKSFHFLQLKRWTAKRKRTDTHFEL